MAITKEFLNTNDQSVVAAWMQENLVPKYFASVDVNGNIITCQDEDGNLLLKIDGVSNAVAITAYQDSSVSAVTQTTSVQGCDTAALCENGALIMWRNSSKTPQMFMLITKTNNEKTAMVACGSINNNTHVYENTHRTAYGDVNPVTNQTVYYISSNQTQLVPFCTDASINTVSYTPNAFYMPIGQYITMGFGTIAMDNHIYLTNGYWAILDS